MSKNILVLLVMFLGSEIALGDDGKSKYFACPGSAEFLAGKTLSASNNYGYGSRQLYADNNPGAFAPIPGLQNFSFYAYKNHSDWIYNIKKILVPGLTTMSSALGGGMYACNYVTEGEDGSSDYFSLVIVAPFGKGCTPVKTDSQIGYRCTI